MNRNISIRKNFNSHNILNSKLSLLSRGLSFFSAFASLSLSASAAFPATNVPANPGKPQPIAPSQQTPKNTMEDDIMNAYMKQAGDIGQGTRVFNNIDVASDILSEFAPWWAGSEKNVIGKSDSAQPLSIEDLYIRALHYSAQIKVFSDLPIIRETAIREAKGAFDTHAYLNSKYNDTNDPVGSTLTTGSANRFLQHEWDNEAGLRKKIITGAEITLSQSAGRTSNNSIYLTPDPQSNAKLKLSIMQPLLKGGGVTYNSSIIEIAKLDSQVALSEFIRQSESHLLEITRSYWALYAARIVYLQKLKLVETTTSVVDELRGRLLVDAQHSQLMRAESSLAARRSDLVRSEAAVRNAQDRLKALINDPELLASPNLELIPTDPLALRGSNINAEQAAIVALENRPEINQAFLQLRACTIRERMGRNELLPELNLILEGYLSGLNNGNVSNGIANEWQGGGQPSGAIGFSFSFPIENNEAKAQLERRRVELRQQINQLQTTLETVLMEVKISAREVTTAHREMQAKYKSVQAFEEDLKNIESRRQLLASSSNNEMAMNDYLDKVLDAQDRKARSEEEFIDSAAEYQIAIVNLERSKGKLLSYSDIGVYRTRDMHGLPLLYLQKNQHSSKEIKPLDK